MVGLRYTGLLSFPHPIVWKVGRVSSETAEAPDSRCAVWRQYPHPDATVGVLIVPLKGSENMFRSEYSLTDSHSVPSFYNSFPNSPNKFQDFSLGPMPRWVTGVMMYSFVRNAKTYIKIHKR